jgi:hypothetical protein
LAWLGVKAANRTYAIDQSMVNLGTKSVKSGKDGLTIQTKDLNLPRTLSTRLLFVKTRRKFYLLDYIEKPYSSLMAKQTSIEQDGTILEALSNAMFVGWKRSPVASGKMRMHHIKILPE